MKKNLSSFFLYLNGKAEITNSQSETGSIVVTKKVQYNSVADKVTEDFYVALFSDAAGTVKVSEVQKISLNNASSGTAEFKDLTVGDTYYVFETNKKGTKVGDVYGQYKVSGNGKAVTIERNDRDKNATIINNHETVNVSGAKTWDDGNYQNVERPESITIRLLANDKKVKEIKVTEKDGWSWNFDNLDKYDKDGNEITYTISEVNTPDNYSAKPNGYDMTNKYTPDSTEVTVTKIWDEAKGYQDIRPAQITVQLYKDKLIGDEPVGDPVVLKPDADGNWSYTWTGLPKKGLIGNINYTVKEVDKVTGYKATTSETTENNVVITNKLETVNVDGSKKWVGDTVEDRPESITIKLLANGDMVDSQIVTPDAKGNWKWSFTDLPKYKMIGNEIKEVTYTIEEVEVEGYETSVKGYNVTNTKEKPTPEPSEEPTPTPENTPEPSTTPDVPENTPEPSATPGTTPEATATPAATPETTPGQTPGPESTPTPEVVPTPDNTPNPVVTPGNNPTPTPPHGTVLGARKVRMGGTQAAVLGARRGADFAVLGKRRRPSTGDSMALLIWIITMSVAMGGAITSSTLLSLENGRKRRRRR